MPEAEQAERQKEERQEDHVASGDQEDEGCDRKSDRKCADHRVVGDGRPSPTAVIGL